MGTDGFWPQKGTKGAGLLRWRTLLDHGLHGWARMFSTEREDVGLLFLQEDAEGAEEKSGLCFHRRKRREPRGVFGGERWRAGAGFFFHRRTQREQRRNLVFVSTGGNGGARSPLSESVFTGGNRGNGDSRSLLPPRSLVRSDPHSEIFSYRRKRKNRRRQSSVPSVGSCENKPGYRNLLLQEVTERTEMPDLCSLRDLL